MNFILCDTNIFISLFRGIATTITELKSIGDEHILIPSISVMELYRGMRNKAELTQMRKKLGSYNIIHYNEEVSELAIKLVLNYRLSQDLTIPDAIIAAMGVVYEIPLFTYNVKDFKFIPHLSLYNLQTGQAY